MPVPARNNGTSQRFHYPGWKTVSRVTSSVAASRVRVSAGKRISGNHSLLVFLDRPEIAGGEALTGLRRLGHAESNTVADHVTVLEEDLESLATTTNMGQSGLIRREDICVRRHRGKLVLLERIPQSFRNAM